MNPIPPTTPAGPEDRVFLVLLVAITLAFAWIVQPFFGAVLWAVILAIMFAPLYRRLLPPLRQRRTLAAIATVISVLVIVILPLTLVTISLVQEGAGLYQRIQSGEVSLGRYFRQMVDALPAWVVNLLDRFELTNLAALQERLSAGLTRAVQWLAAQALNIGQNTVAFLVSLFLMLYLLFFLLRDGVDLARRIKAVVPLHPELQRDLAGRFATVIRATVKGSVVVAIVQGALGGLALWLLDVHAPVLWGVLMAVLSLLPAVGTGLVWVPIAAYLLATGATWRGLGLVAYGILVIGTVDNVLRPILVGKDTRMPDYVVLLSTLGGLAVIGFNGFIIGPVVAAMFIAVWDIYAASRAEPRPV